MKKPIKYLFLLSLILMQLGNAATPEDRLKNTQPASKSSLFSNLFSGNSLSANEPLPVDKVFVRLPIFVDEEGIHIKFKIKDGYYIYKDKFKFEAKNNSNINLATAYFPKGKVKDDPNFGKMEVYYNDLEIVVPVTNKSPQIQNLNLEVTFQGCAEKGICYPQTKRDSNITIPAGLISFTESSITQNLNVFNLNQQEQDASEALKSGNIWLVVSLFFGSGLLLAFTACLFPMIPILSSIITGQDDTTTSKAFRLSVAYVLPMALVYSTIGIASGLFGESISAWFQKPWVLLGFGALIVAIALSMFGLYNIQMPGAIQHKVSAMSNQQKSGTYLGAIIMGGLSTLIVGACSVPVLSVAMGFIAQTGDPVLGGIALFAMGLGIGVPLIIIGTSAGKLLPKPGVWMERVKQSFGLIMLAVALYIIEPVFSTTIMMALWGMLLIGSGVYLGVFNTGKLTGWQQVAKSIGLVVLIYGTLLIIGMATGKGSLFAPLEGLAINKSQQSHLTFNRIKTVSQFKQELATAKQNGQYIMLDFYADWCRSCVELEQFTFSQKSVQKSLQKVRLLQMDVTLNDEKAIELLKHFGVIGPPAILFFDKNGVEIRSHRLNGFFDAEDFNRHINSILI